VAAVHCHAHGCHDSYSIDLLLLLLLLLPLSAQVLLFVVSSALVVLMYIAL
jgi:hypothetical protein